ncbi:AmmeMemoRadiSam system radical SAM enzyme [Pararhodospirillum oryzae]|uniref:AmmeMemoRadiSam system radical SAM enzyme n=1 Tax=Pararhodospirillum oryzae TaxID=478448 RepID=A0A512H426_9PROT|nr:AmmeMemoRadiSam system radical SAM enzyme [Pararhodospirillum oryzae]
MARHWHATEDGRHVVCDACPRACRLGPERRGLCFVRMNQGGALVLTTWGRSSGFCIDPIEKKPLYHFLPGTPVLSFGSAGCNLTCAFCQNWDLSRAREIERLNSPATPGRIATLAREQGCRSVAFTYNDPIPMLEYAVDVAHACHDQAVRTVAVTAGYVSPGAREDFFAPMDAANVDLKAFNDGFYRKMASARLAPVLDTLTWLARESTVWVEITTLLIPGVNDADDEIKALAAWIAATMGPHVPLHLSAFHPAHRMNAVPPTPHATLRRARALARAEGLEHVYLGNVHDPEADSTWCPGCGARLIERDWYTLGAWGLDDAGACGSCGRALAGVFDGPPGTWGRQRRPVRP